MEVFFKFIFLFFLVARVHPAISAINSGIAM